MPPADPVDTEALLERLLDAPARIAGAAGSWRPAQLYAAPAAGDWSAAEILAHLRASDDILAPRVYAMLARDNPPLAAYDERRWAAVAGYAQTEFHDSLTVFTLRRTELVEALRQLAPEDWGRTGAHEERGTISVLDVVTGLVEHEEEHCAQLEALRR